MISSTEVHELATALSAAQGELENATKGNTNPAFRSRYADITACLDAVRPCLARHGLALVQGVEECDENRIRVTTRLLHKSGQWIESTLAVPLGKKDAQGVGAAATYGRRYALAAMVGLGQEDDDGNTASNVVAKTSTRKAPGATVDDLKRAFQAAKTRDDIGSLVEQFVKLPPEQQAELKPFAKAARERVGL